MTAKILLFLASCSISTLSFCQKMEYRIIPFEEDGLWGYMNHKKEVVIEPKYEEAYPSTSDRYRIKTKGKYGHIDRNGKMVIKAKYDEASDFIYSVAKVTRKNKSENIKRDGKRNDRSIELCGTHDCAQPRMSDEIEIIERDRKLGMVHDKIFRDENNCAYYQPDTIHPIFDSIVPISHQLMYLIKDSLISFSHEANYLGGLDYVLDNTKFEFEEIELFDCFLCGEGIDELIGVKKNGLWGYAKLNYYIPEIFIEPKYLSIESLADGFAFVEFEKEKFGYIDQQGNEYFIR